jgi:hypothetical protein
MSGRVVSDNKLDPKREFIYPIQHGREMAGETFK